MLAQLNGRFEPKADVVRKFCDLILSGMNVLAIFDYEFSAHASGAVWIVDSENNRVWFSRSADELDPNSAIFYRDKRSTVAETLYQVVENITDHHPEWTSVSVLGLQVAALSGFKTLANGLR